MLGIVGAGILDKYCDKCARHPQVLLDFSFPAAFRDDYEWMESVSRASWSMEHGAG